MSGYVIVHGKVKDAEKMQEYGAAAGPIVGKFGGEVISRGPVEVLSGSSDYQLAVVIDDAFQGITHVVRGSDLLSSTPRQIFLQSTIGLPTPNYGHIPVIVNNQQQKLSKQTFAKAISNKAVTENLLQALAYLRQPIPPSKFTNKADDLLQWSARHWDLASIPDQLTIAELSS